MTEKPARRQRIRCPVWNSPLLEVVEDGVEVKCKSCRGTSHLIKRAELERMWAELKEHVQRGTVEGREETHDRRETHT